MSALPLPAARRRPGVLRLGASDERLVARVRAGDETAFETIFDRHHGPLLAFCRHMLGSREEGEDAVQQTFVSAYRGLRDSDAQIQLKPWLYAIARNRCLTMLRMRREEVSLDDEAAAPSTGGLAAEIERRADLRELLGDIARLPDDQRAALVLAELGALSHDEIAAALEVRRDKVKALVFQARESLAASRTARDTPCHEIREQLSTLTGGALRRGPLRRHLEGCAGCRAFRDDVRGQRASMAAILPVVPTAGLKGGVLGAIFGGGAAASGTAVSAGLLSGVALKVAAAVAVAGAVGGGVAVERHGSADAPHPAVAPQHATPATPARPAAHTGARATPATPATPPAHARARRSHGSPAARHRRLHAPAATHGHGGASPTAPGHLKAPHAPATGKGAGKPAAPAPHKPNPEHAAKPATPPTAHVKPPTAAEPQQPAPQGESAPQGHGQGNAGGNGKAAAPAH